MHSSDLHTVAIDLAERSYHIAIRGSLFDNPLSYAELPNAHSALIVTNTTVAPLYAGRLQKALAGKYPQVHTVVLPDGEVFKTWESLNLIFDALLSHGCDRKTTLFALGGGVVGDMAGFAAASFMRGVPFVQVPTTLLAQVDSSVGGKTAINHPLGKNMIGAFYQPLKVVCDLDTLKTLPARELSAGLAEVIKYGPIADMDFLAWLEANMDALLAREPAALAHVVKRSCEIKADVVGQDERESGLRAILNFGHTFGHAIEAGLGYGEWLQSLLELQRNAGDPQDFLDSVKVDLFPDEVYVFTPKGRILALPAGATAVDFAYAVHSDIGNYCVAVRIDRRLAPLSSVLETGQTVEIITARTATPHPGWLSFVVTGKARAAIRHFLKNIDHQKAVELGRRLLEIELARLGTPMAQVPEQNIAGLLREFSAKAMDDLLEDVGLGKRLAAVVATHLVSGMPLTTDRPPRSGLRRALARVAPRWLVGKDGHSAPLAIKGTEGLVVSYGKCCRPIPGDPIRGYVSAGRGVVIHVDGCPSTAEFAKQPDKWLDVEWQPAGDARFPVDIRVEVVDQRGELATLAAAIADMDCNIANVELNNRDGIHAVDDFTLEVRDRVHLARIMKRLRTLKSVRRIIRKRG